MACIFMRQVSPSLVALMTIDEMIVMSVHVDPELPKAEDNAHYEAMGNIRGPNGVTLRADWDGMNAALNRVFASVPEVKVVDMYNSVSSITDSGVPACRNPWRMVLMQRRPTQASASQPPTAGTMAT